MESTNQKKMSAKEEEFAVYAKNLYSKSLVTGIPEIVVAGNWYLRVIRFVIFVCCITGFIYQSLVFMELYWKYPTILDIQISRKGEIMMPGITACDPNGIRLSKYCKNHSCKKPQLERRFCRCFPPGRYCDKKKMYPHVMIPAQIGDISKMAYLYQGQRKYMMPKAKDFIPSCILKRPPSTKFENCRNITLIPSCTSRILEPTACFSINSLSEMPNKQPQNISVSTVVELELYSPPSEYDPDLFVMYKQLSLHSPYALSNPFNEGVFLHSERSYKIYVKQTVKHLLKSPYDTHCFDYLESWRKNGGLGPLSQSDCIQTCKILMNRKYGEKCLPIDIWYPIDDKRCPVKDKFYGDYSNLTKLKDTHHKRIDNILDCERNCRPACWEILYEITKQETPQPEVRKDLPPVKETGLTKVTISFQKMEETLYTYKAKYEVVETFSYIGGYVGIWLGVSLLALFDFLEATMFLIKYPFRKRKRLGAPKTT